MNHKVFLSLGSNIGDRKSYLQQAIERLDSEKEVDVIRLSSIYETDPVGVLDQPKFLNMVIEADTSLTPERLLRVTQEIENELDRTREKRWGPRTIDLDILLFNDENIRMTNLSIPHPRMCERAFVMVPLQEIAPDIIYPLNHKCISELAGGLSADEKKGVRLWEKRS